MKSFKTRWRTVQPILNLGNRCTYVVSFGSPPVDKWANIPLDSLNGSLGGVLRVWPI